MQEGEGKMKERICCSLIFLVLLSNVYVCWFIALPDIENDKPALAFCLAIEKLIDSGAEHANSNRDSKQPQEPPLL